MTTESAMNQVGAISRVEGWHSVEWRKVNQNVRRLQVRIVKATQERRWNKVKALQHLLTHSRFADWRRFSVGDDSSVENALSKRKHQLG